SSRRYTCDKGSDFFFMVPSSEENDIFGGISHSHSMISCHHYNNIRLFNKFQIIIDENQK
ncbi:MAG: hypothetical protein P4K92_06025, partial [Candidatus Nitrosotalea sp.]|nr:hypothetical protein [Candidatus Nitrosotalea sp.]